MAKSLWDVFRKELNKPECDWCGSQEDLFKFDGDIVCRHCLENEEYEEPEKGLTLEERNR